MEIESGHVANGSVRIHYLDANRQSSLAPLLICPGLSETAEDYVELMEYVSPRRCVALSFRGRGHSDTPDSGYTLQDHVGDLACVVEAAQLNRFHLYAYSRGVSYALGYLKRHSSQVLNVLLQEYPAEHKRMTEDWADDYIHNYLVPYSRLQRIRPEAVRGIQRESEQVRFDFPIARKMLLLAGALEGRLLDEDGIRAYRKLGSDVTVKTFLHSGHDIRNTEKDLLYQTIHDFIRNA